MMITKGMKTCRLKGKVDFIFEIKELMDYRTNKAGAILVCFKEERDTSGTKAMAQARLKSRLR